jgi:hypothetical protein
MLVGFGIGRRLKSRFSGSLDEFQTCKCNNSEEFGLHVACTMWALLYCEGKHPSRCLDIRQLVSASSALRAASIFPDNEMSWQ